MNAHDDEFPMSCEEQRATMPDKPKRLATMLISTDILRDAIGLPEEVEIVGEPSGNVRLLIQSEHIPEGQHEVVAVWIKKGRDAEPEFLHFEMPRSTGMKGGE